MNDPRVSWLTVLCPGCRARFRLKEAYAHLRGRCPQCGFRIPAQRPRPFQPHAPTTTADSLELAPIEEEWPEPAQAEEELGGKDYDLAQAPARWEPEPEREEREPGIEGYDLSEGWEPMEVPALPPLPKAYDVGPTQGAATPKEPAIPYQLSMAERNPLRAPPPPAHPLWQGVFGFPWHTGNVRIWLLLAVGWGLVVLLATAMVFVESLIPQKNVIGAFLPGLMISLLISSGFTAPFFLVALQDTAAGNRDVAWPHLGFSECLGKLAYLLWIGGIAALPFGFLPPLTAVAVATLVFPVLLLSSLSARHPLILLERKVLGRLVRSPIAVFIFYLQSAGLVAPSVLLGWWTIHDLKFQLLPITPLVWSATLLIYARLLGRLAWVISRKK
jgi:hypothetical protein